MHSPFGRRRQLRFDSVDDITPDIDRLLRGHVTVGHWSVGQICNHLATAFRFSIEGTPHKSPPILRRTIGPVIKQICLVLDRIPQGVKIHNDYLPGPGLDDAQEADLLRDAIARYRGHTGPFDEHPKMGHLTRVQVERFHCIHCAHHLSFAIPQDVTNSAPPA